VAHKGVFCLGSVTAAATHNSSNLAPGYKLDRYELLCPLAEGGMASVWVARQRGKHGFEKLVALKTILPIFATDARFQEMFLDEARIASRIEHPNVAQILDLGEEHEVLYLAMEYVDGEALSKLNHACQKEGIRIPPGILLRILADTCAGLHEAHEMTDGSGAALEIVHRDVSPHNVLVSTRGVAKLIDFGIAKARSRASGETNSGVLKGKTQYMAPEQALGKPVDRRADIWSVGVMLYYLLSGKPPYDAENQLATLHLLSSGRPPMPLPPSVHPAIAAVVRKTLSHAPDARYQTAADLREALEAAMLAAKVPATQADVAAFSLKYLAERGERRRQAIDIALAAATERRRIEELLKPASGSSPAFTPAPPSSHALLAAQEPTRAEAPGARNGSVPPPEVASKTGSYATPASSALDAEATPPKSRKPLALFLVLGLLAIATGASLALLRPRLQARRAAIQLAASPPPPAPRTNPVESSAPAPPAAPENIVDTATSAAKVTAPPPPTTAPTSKPKESHGSPPVAAAISAPGKAKTPPKNQTVDDGF
jgi:serine/threonine protein kinase